MTKKKKLQTEGKKTNDNPRKWLLVERVVKHIGKAEGNSWGEWENVAARGL